VPYKNATKRLEHSRVGAAKYRSRNRERLAAERADSSRWPAKACRAARSRAKKLGVAFDLSPEDIIIPAVCPFTLKPFVFGCGKLVLQSPSLDRIKPDMGYVSGNVRVISFHANTVKSNITDPDIFQRLADDARLWGLV
jgi:hypothetical protein